MVCAFDRVILLGTTQATVEVNRFLPCKVVALKKQWLVYYTSSPKKTYGVIDFHKKIMLLSSQKKALEAPRTNTPKQTFFFHRCENGIAATILGQELLVIHGKKQYLVGKKMCEFFGGSDHFSQVGPAQGDPTRLHPTRPVGIEYLQARPVRLRKPLDSPRFSPLRFGNLLT